MKIISIAVAAAALSLLSMNVSAQDRKKSGDSTQDSAAKGSGAAIGGWQKCEGSVFLIQDGASYTRCQRRDGKLCTVEIGSSGQATLVNCR